MAISPRKRVSKFLKRNRSNWIKRRKIREANDDIFARLRNE